MRRAQASLEYIITYGWAFLVILIVLGALAYFGVLNPSRWVPDECDFGAQLECADYNVSEGTAAIQLLVRNNFGKEIDITRANVKKEDGTFIGSLSGSPSIQAGSTTEIEITSVSGVLFAGEKQRTVIIIEFQRSGSSNKHNLTGVVYTTTKS